MKKTFTLMMLVLFVSASFAQVTDKEDDLKKKAEVKQEGWQTGGVFNLNFAQTAFKNWSAGGINSFAVNSLASLHANYLKGVSSWENSLDLGYGFLQQGRGEKSRFMKTDDKIDFASKYGRKINDKLYYAALVNFKTQFTEGFDYEVSDSIAISNFMAPGYLIGAIGIDYKPNKHFSAFVAPLTSKTTFVMDQKLADAGAYGVEKAETNSTGAIIEGTGANIKSEFGGYIKIVYQNDIMKNVNFLTKLDLFSNYLNNPQNIDVNWEVLINMKVNKFITASIGTQLIYDDDIDIAIDDNDDGVPDRNSPAIQFKEVLAIGLTFKF